MAKAKSGGAREYEQRHLERNAKRPVGYNERSVAAFKRLKGPGKTRIAVLGKAVAHLELALEQAAADLGMPPEQRREQVGRLAAALAKACEPKRLIDELAAELRQALTLLEGRYGVSEPQGRPAEAPTTSH